MSVKKAVIPAAGLGTRVLPVSKAMPKEMLPIVDKPAIQYIVEEAVASGITDILIITNRGKDVIEDHFDHSIELDLTLRKKGRDEIADSLAQIATMANIHFLRQKETKGLGHAVLQARAFVGNEPFAVLYGDDVILGDTPATKELCDVYDRYGKGVAGIKKCRAKKSENIVRSVWTPLPIWVNSTAFLPLRTWSKSRPRKRSFPFMRYSAAVYSPPKYSTFWKKRHSASAASFS